MADMPFEELVNQALRLDTLDQARLLARLAVTLQAQLANKTGELTNTEPYTPEEVEAMMQYNPLTPEEAEAQGLIGGWADMNIADGAEWVNEKKRQRRERNAW